MTEIGLNVAGAAIRWAVTSLGFGSFSRLETAAGDFRRRLGRRRPLPDPVELAPIFLPYLGDGDRDDPRLRGALLGLSGRHDVSAVAYAMLEGVALAAKSVLGALRKAGQPFDELRVSGGAARLALSAQLKADVLGVPVLQLAADSTAVGTGLLAAEATGNGATARASIKSLLSAGTPVNRIPGCRRWSRSGRPGSRSSGWRKRSELRGDLVSGPRRAFLPPKSVEPLEPGPVRVGTGKDVNTVPNEEEARSIPPGRGVRENSRALVGEPDGAQVAYSRREGSPLGLINVGEHRAVIDDERGAGGRLRRHPGEIIEQVALVDRRRPPAGRSYCTLETLGPIGLTWPHQTRQPSDVLIVVDVEGVEVDARPPGDFRDMAGQRDRPVWAARQGRRL